MKTPTIGTCKRRNKWHFRWKRDGKPRYRLIERPDEPKAMAQQRAALLLEIMAGPTIKVKTLSLEEHLADFLTEVRSRGGSSWGEQVERQVRRILKEAKVRSIRDMTVAKIEVAIKAVKCRCEQTERHYRQAIKQFSKWLFATNRTDHHLLARLAKPKVRHRPHKRDRFQPNEAETLLRTAAASRRIVQGYAGVTRSWLYRLAMLTGLRRKELAALAPECFDLAGKALTVSAAYTKNGQTATLPLPTKVIPSLREWLGGNAAGEPLFPDLRRLRTGNMIRRDMKDAGIPAKTPAGSRTFHSLRNSYISSLWDLGLPGTLVQRLARHSDINLTASYARPRLGEEQAAVDRLPG